MSSSTSDTEPAQLRTVSGMPAEADNKVHYVQLGPLRIPLTIANLIFLILAVGAQVGQNVSLPLWLDSTSVTIPRRVNSTRMNSTDEEYYFDYSNSTSNQTSVETLSVDAYFVYSFACISFVIIFGLTTLLIKVVSPELIGETERTFPQFQLFLVGFSDALNGVLVVFASPPYRTKPLLQSILGNFTIPMTVVIRFFMLRRVPTLIQGIAALATFIGLFIALMPDIAGLDPSYPGEPSGAGRVLWPMFFMLGFVPAAFMNVLEEKLLKQKRKAAQPNREKINLFYFLFWTSLYQFLTAAVLFWIDIVPFYGEADNITAFGDQYWFGLRCFFGGAGCTSDCGVRGTAFILCYVLSYIGGGLLLRHAEGATYLAVAGALVTPLGSLFWALFQPTPFKWHPHGSWDLWFALISLAIMVPAIFAYSYFRPKEDGNRVPAPDTESIQGEVTVYPGTGQGQNVWSARPHHRQATEKTPLLGDA